MVRRSTLLFLPSRLYLVVDRLQTRTLEWLKSGPTGQSMVEYAIIIALVAIIGMGAIQLLGGQVVQVFQSIVTKLQGVG